MPSHRRALSFGTPAAAILLSSAIYCALAWVSFTQLIAVYAWLRIATSIMTVLSAWRLRHTAPEMPRPFRVPWGRVGIVYSVVAPVLMSVVALLASDRFGLIGGPASLVLGLLAYLIFKPKLQAS